MYGPQVVSALLNEFGMDACELGISGFGRVVVALKNFVASDAVRRFVFWPDS